MNDTKLEEQEIKTTKSFRFIKPPFFIKFISLIQIIVFIYQLINNWSITNSPIQTQPFNFLIGPTPEVLIHQGARFTPCMKSTDLDTELFKCPAQSNSKLNSPGCELKELCGFSSETNQWYRFIIPVFLHGGILHILFNLISQYSIGIDIEKDIGTLRTIIIYFLTAISGFIFGADFSSFKMTSVGASGAIFGLLGCELSILVLNWNSVYRPLNKLMKLTIIIILNLLVGFIPLIDNFSHIGGFVTGVVIAVIICPIQSKITNYFKWFLRLLCLALFLFFFIEGLIGFYSDSLGEKCSWCKYINCIPFTSDMCANL